MRTKKIINTTRQRRYATDRRGVRYVAAHMPVPKAFRDPVTCGTCYRTWDDAVVTSWTPAPSGRCPFEDQHVRIPPVTPV